MVAKQAAVVLLCVFLLAVTNASDVITYRIGDHANFTLESIQYLNLIFVDNVPAIIEFSPRSECPLIVAQKSNTASYSPQKTKFGTYVLPVTPDLGSSPSSILIGPVNTPCIVDVRSFNANFTSVNFTKSMDSILSPGYADFFTGEFENSAVALELKYNYDECSFTAYWGFGNVSEVSYIEKLPKYDQLNTVLYSYYGHTSFGIAVLASSSNVKNCHYQMNLYKVDANEIKFNNGALVNLNMTDATNILAVIRDIPTDSPIQFNLSIADKYAIKAVTIRTNDPGSKTIDTPFDSDFRGPYFISCGNPTSTLYLSVTLWSENSVDNVLSATITLNPATNLTIGQEVIGRVLENQINYYSSEIEYQYPQYFTIQLNANSDCVSTYVLMDRSVFPDLSTTMHYDSKVRDGNSTFFRYALSSQSVASLHTFHVGITTAQTSCDYSIKLINEEFPSFKNNTPVDKALPSNQIFYYKYTITPKTAPTYIAINLKTQVLASLSTIYWKLNDLPSLDNNDGSLPTHSDYPYTVYVPPIHASSSATIYFFLECLFDVPDQVTVVIDEVYPTPISPSVVTQLPYKCMYCFSFFTLSNFQSELATFIFQTPSETFDNSELAAIYVGIGSLPNENSTQFINGQVMMNDIGVTSWDNVFFGIQAPVLQGYPIFVEEEGVPIKWGRAYYYQSQNNTSSLYLKTVIPKSSQVMRVRLGEYIESFGVKDAYLSFDGIVNKNNSFKIPNQGSSVRPEYSTHLSLSKDSPLYVKIDPSQVSPSSYQITVDDSFEGYVTLGEGSQTEGKPGIIVSGWMYYSIDWFPYQLPGNVYDVYFTVQLNQSSNRLQLVYGDGLIPSLSEYTLKGDQDGDKVVIKMSKVPEKELPDTLVKKSKVYLGLYAGDDTNASTISFSITAYIVNRGSDNSLTWILVGSIGGGLILIGIAIFVAWRVVIYRRSRGYQPVSSY